jgi:N-ethylmaleimide reductase
VTAPENRLLTPFQLGPHTLPNRVVMAPMTRSRAAAGNVQTGLNATYYAQRASAGLLITEGTQVSPQGVGYPSTPGIHSPEQVAGWRTVTDAVHARGGRIFAQLWHVGRISHPSLQPDGGLPVAPSAVAAEGTVFTGSGPQPFVTPRALETEEIAGVVRQFAAGARCALDAGFDGVELHGANGYLIDQFLRDGTNRRTDRYGGSVENRVRFLVEVAEAVAAVWGADRVGARLSPTNPFNSMHDSDPGTVFAHAAAKLSELGLVYLHVVEPVSTGPDGAPDGERVTPRLRAAFRGALIANGGYGLESAERVLAAGEADLVSFGAPYIANPDLVERFAVGAPLALPDRATFYGGAEAGYSDYPVWEGRAAEQPVAG